MLLINCTRMHATHRQDTSSPTMRHHHRYHDVPWWATGFGAKAAGTRPAQQFWHGPRKFCSGPCSPSNRKISSFSCSLRVGWKLSFSSEGAVPSIVEKGVCWSNRGRHYPGSSEMFVIVLKACRDGDTLHQGHFDINPKKQICCGHLWRCWKLFENGSKPTTLGFGWFSGTMSEGPLWWSKPIAHGALQTFSLSVTEVIWSHCKGLCAMRCKNL